LYHEFPRIEWVHRCEELLHEAYIVLEITDIIIFCISIRVLPGDEYLEVYFIETTSLIDAFFHEKYYHCPNNGKCDEEYEEEKQFERHVYIGCIILFFSRTWNTEMPKRGPYN
jgi:hypothetical protein